MTFKQHLAGLKPNNDARGDFLRLATADREFPDVDDWDQIQSHLNRRHGSSVITDAAADVWKEHRRLARKAGRAIKS